MSETRILVVEDDHDINRLVSECLSKEGYAVDEAYDGMAALKMFFSKDYHLTILDLMIPKPDGFEVLRRIREKGTVPVLILSAKAEDTDKIIGLGLGADDYMVKPFSIYELAARVKAHLRRYLQFGSSAAGENLNIIKHMDVEMDLNAYGVKVCGQAAILTAKEFEILKLFMTNPKKVLTKGYIFETIWHDDFISDDNTIMVHIRRLREKIEKDPSNPRIILTIRNIGYKLGEG